MLAECCPPAARSTNCLPESGRNARRMLPKTWNVGSRMQPEPRASAESARSRTSLGGIQWVAFWHAALMASVSLRLVCAPVGPFAVPLIYLLFCVGANLCHAAEQKLLPFFRLS